MINEDEKISSRYDQDSKEFREESVLRMTETLQFTLKILKAFLSEGDIQGLVGIISGFDDLLNRKLLNIDKKTDIHSSKDTIIAFKVGLTVWKKPSKDQVIYNEIVRSLVDKVFEDSDWDRFANGFYLMEILLHKYKNGNGRTARAIKLLCNKMGNQNSIINEKEVRTVLGLDSEGVSQAGENTFKINVHPDYQNLVLGVAYFGLHKGLSMDDVTNKLKLNSLMPEKSIELLSNKLGISIDNLKKDFINFMAIESDLSFCSFPI
ncbi:MAG: hypothetical protein H6772_02565 [Pseudomonadales bacterium]|nr:hypothetical protein [Pseudomonadales bacterium]